MTDIQAPDSAVLMVTNRDYRLSSLSGYVINFKANEPTMVVPHCYEDAIRIGAVLCQEQPEKEAKEEQPKVDPNIAEAARLEQEQKREAVRQATLKLLAIGDSTAFKASGPPKANKLIAELPPEIPRPTAQEIDEVWADMQDEIDLIED